MIDLQTIMLVVGVAALLYALWRPSVPGFVVAGTINLIAIGLYVF